MQQFDSSAAARIREAVAEVERGSAAELVVEIRARSGSYAHADARFAALLTFLSLVALVFMPWTVPPLAVVLDPLLSYPLGLLIAGRSAALRRLFTTSVERRTAVRTEAAALFHDRGIANTRNETGVLFYASLLERRIEVLADRGILRALDANGWNALLAELHDQRAIDPDVVVAAIRKIGALVQQHAPAAEGDVDELTNAPEIGA